MMNIINTLLQGAFEIECSPHKDERGWFARYFCQEELYEVNGGRQIVQINSFSERRMKKISSSDVSAEEFMT